MSFIGNDHLFVVQMNNINVWQLNYNDSSINEPKCIWSKCENKHEIIDIYRDHTILPNHVILFQKERQMKKDSFFSNRSRIESMNL
jgi:hypothetical protein